MTATTAFKTFLSCGLFPGINTLKGLSIYIPDHGANGITPDRWALFFELCGMTAVDVAKGSDRTLSEASLPRLFNQLGGNAPAGVEITPCRNGVPRRVLFTDNQRQAHNDKDLPADIWFDTNGHIKYEYFYLQGSKHNERGPAVIRYTPLGAVKSSEYYMFGVKTTGDKLQRLLQKISKETKQHQQRCKSVSNITPSVGAICI